MGWENGIAGHHVGLADQVLADLAGQRQNPKATCDRDWLMPISVDHLRGKKTGGAAPSVQYR